MKRITVRKGQTWASKLDPNHRVVIYRKGRRGGWDVLTASGKMHNTTEHTLNRHFMLVG